MNWSKFDKYIYKDIGKVIKDFCWNNNCENITGDKHKLHTIAWDKICKSKCEGDLGLRSTKILVRLSYLNKLGKFLSNLIISRFV